MLVKNKLLSFSLFILVSMLSLNVTAYDFQADDITIIAPKFIIGDNKKYQTQIKNVVLNRFDEIFNIKQDQSDDKRIVTEFFDYTCGHCKNMAKILDELNEARENIGFIYKQFPIRGDKARLAARAAIASKSQNQYLAFHKLLIQTKPLNKKAILQKANLLGLDLTRLEMDMESKSTYTEVSDTYGLAQALKITGTPTFIILGKHSNGKPHIFYIAGIMEKNDLEQFLR